MRWIVRQPGEISGAARKRIVLGILFVLALLADVIGLTAPVERFLVDQRFQLLSTHGSGRSVIVEIDAQSLDALGVWPLPREYYADVVETLLRAGASTVAVDVDFSARSDAASDARLADAVREGGGRLILPAFAQSRSWARPGSALVVEPMAELAENAQVASVNVSAAPDGRIRAYPVLFGTGGELHPSLAAVAAGGSFQRRSFIIDFAIDPTSIERIDFQSVLRDGLAPGRLAGRTVFLGATALEIGDEYPVPVHGYLPGVVIQALAFESLVNGRALWETGWIVTVAGLVVIFLLAARLIDLGPVGTAAAVAGTGAAAFSVSLGLQATTPISLGIGAWLLAGGGWFGVSVVDRLHTQAVQLFRQRMAATYRRALMRRVVDDSFDGVIVTDARGRIEVFNPTAAKILRLPSVKALGQNVADVLPPRIAAEIAEMRDAVDDGNSPRELTLELPGAGVVTLEMLVSRSMVNPSRRRYERRKSPRAVYIHTFRDMSIRKEAEIALERAMNEAIEASQSKSDFIAHMSHEFRTPLNAIIGFADFIRSRPGDINDPDKTIEYINDIYRSGRHLLELVNDILDLAKIENNAQVVDPTPCAPADLLTDPVETISPIARGKDISIVVDIAPTAAAFCDRRAMRQCITNILTNAVKFSHRGTRVDIIARQDAGRILFEVSDSGIGMQPDLVAKAGQPFLRAPNALVAGIEGTGLGLAISKRLLEMQGGDLVIESQLGVGTTVRISVPAAGEAPTEMLTGDRTGLGMPAEHSSQRLRAGGRMS